MVADALNRKDPVKTTCIRAMNTNVQDLKDTIRHTQQQVLIKCELKQELDCGAESKLETRTDGLIHFFDRIWIPKSKSLRSLILDDLTNPATRFI